MENLRITSCLGYHSAAEYIKNRARVEKSIFLLASVIKQFDPSAKAIFKPGTYHIRLGRRIQKDIASLSFQSEILSDF